MMEADAMQLSVVVVSFESSATIRLCLESLLASSQDLACEVLVVDNASTDETPSIVRSIAGVRLLAMDGNLGFARACNRAAREARGRYLLFLNPDTEVLPGAIARLLEFAEAHPEGGIFGGRTLYANGALNPTCCFAQPTLWSAFCLGSGLASLLRGSALFNPENLGGWRRDSARSVGVVTGCFLLTSRQHWDELGGFDERFFLYSEDTDLCLRSQASGRASLFTPEAVIVHHGGGSDRIRSAKRIRVFRARVQFFRKHRSPAAAGFVVAMLDLYALTRTLAHGLWSWRRRDRGLYEDWRSVWRGREAWHRLEP